MIRSTRHFGGCARRDIITGAEDIVLNPEIARHWIINCGVGSHKVYLPDLRPEGRTPPGGPVLMVSNVGPAWLRVVTADDKWDGSPEETHWVEPGHTVKFYLRHRYSKTDWQAGTENTACGWWGSMDATHTFAQTSTAGCTSPCTSFTSETSGCSGPCSTSPCSTSPTTPSPTGTGTLVTNSTSKHPVDPDWSYTGSSISQTVCRSDILDSQTTRAEHTRWSDPGTSTTPPP